MRIRVSHQTVYEYAPPAKSLIQTLRLTPRNHDGQFVVNWRIDVDIDSRLKPGEDAFANITHLLSVGGPVERFTLKVDGEVETHDTAGVVRGTVERFPEQLYLRESPVAAADETIRGFASEVASQAGEDVLTRLHALMGGIHRKVALDEEPGAVSGTAASSFAAGKGTAQDIAHVFIAAARHLEIPARYVSGYLWRKDVGVARDGHAWAEAYSPGLGWIGFDSTLDLCPEGAHVRVAVGLDSLGAAPIRGTWFGGGPEMRAARIEVRCHDTEPAIHQSQSQSQS
jgi:transglutaminase-like putative cysteine protease